MKTNTKKYGMTALLGVLIVGIVLISGCVDDSENDYATVQPTEEPAREPSVGPSDWCPEGTVNPIEKSKITGIEKHTINGKTLNLCCKEMSPDGEKVVKTCNSKDAMYVVTFRDDGTGKMYKTKEIYPEGDKVCSRLFSPDGTVIMERCVKME
jgi:WD40 repeat protein